VIGSSEAIDKEIKIPPYGQALIDKVLVQIPLTNAFSIAFTLIKALISGGSETITIRTLTTINLGIVKLPYEDKQDVTVKK
jgi:hypothetical protein